MKKEIFGKMGCLIRSGALAVTLGLVSNVAYAACSAPSYTSPDCLGYTKTPVDGVRYYGYPLMSSDASQTAVPELQLVSEIKNHTNVVGVVYDPSNPTSLLPLLKQLDTGFSAILFVNDIFTKKNGTLYSSTEVASRIQTLKQTVLPYKSYINFGFDEPVWRAHMVYCGTNTACLWGGPLPAVYNVVTPNLQKWANQLRIALPGVSIMDIEAGPMIRSNLTLPANFDVYGFDCYGNFDNCYGVSVPTMFNTIRSKVVDMNTRYGGYRRLAVVAEAELMYNRTTSDPSVPLNAKNDDEALALAQRYYQMYANDTMVNLVAPWIWQTMNEGPTTFFGARGLPNTRAALENYGRSITGKPVTTWTSAPVIQFMVSSGVRVGERPLWSWSTTGATSCRSITEPTAYPSAPPSGIIVGGVELAARVLDYTIECTGPYGTSQKTIRLTVTN